MKKIFLFAIAFFTQFTFALSLDQVRADLKKSCLPQDSIEMNLRVTVNAAGIHQQTEMYIVNKGANKSYTEIKSTFLNQRSIANGKKMKVVNLNTNKRQILDYDGESLRSNTYANFNPFDSGTWDAPQFYSGNIYKIQGTLGTIYYNNKAKRIEKIESEKDGKNTLTTFTYDANNHLKKMVVSVMVNGVESVVATEFLRLQKSDKVTDSLFEF